MLSLCWCSLLENMVHCEHAKGKVMPTIIRFFVISYLTELTVGSTSNSPTNSIGSNAGRRLISPNQPKRSESDSGHNSSSNCDSNSASSYGSAGSPTSTKAKQRLSSMRQYGQPFGQPSGTLQNSRSIFYISSTSDLRPTSKMGQSVCPTAVG